MKDATIEIISEVKAHPNADRLDLVKILGFQCVTQKGLYQGGEKIVYIRPDAVLPLESWTEEYRKYSPKRIKAVKLRQAWSEGIIVPFNILPIDLSNREVGEDVGEVIGVVHYEPPAPQDLQAKGGLPYGIGKTDEERCLSEETIIKTFDGDKTIREICETQYKGLVYSYDPILNEVVLNNIISHSIAEDNEDWYEIELDNGEKIKATSNHYIYLPELNCYRMVFELNEGDELFLLK